MLRPSFGNMPIASYDTPWNGRIAREKTLDWCKSQQGNTPTTKEIDPGCAKRAFLLRRSDEPEYTRVAWDLPFAEPVGDVLTIVPMGVKALASGHGIQAVQGITEGQRRELMDICCALYDAVRKAHPNMPECPFAREGTKREPQGGTDSQAPRQHGTSSESHGTYGGPRTGAKDIKGIKARKATSVASGGVLAAEGDLPLGLAPGVSSSSGDGDLMSLSAAATAQSRATASKSEKTVVGRYSIPHYPPRAWFEPTPQKMPIPVTITAEGRIFGHAWPWDQCHSGIADRCEIAPRSRADYQYFHRGGVLTADGSIMAVGHLTVGGGHASAHAGMRAAIEHYDDATSTVAVVQVHEDQWGGFVAGALVPDVTEAQIHQLLRSPLSGDWRAKNGNLELIAAHGVNVPGFGVDRPRHQVLASIGSQEPYFIYVGATPAPEPSVDQRVLTAAAELGIPGFDPVSRISSAWEQLRGGGQ